MPVKLLDAVIAAILAAGGEARLSQVHEFLEELRDAGMLEYEWCEPEEALKLAVAVGVLEVRDGRLRLRAPVQGDYARMVQALIRAAGRR